jgi:hypothetical protein
MKATMTEPPSFDPMAFDAGGSAGVAAAVQA